MIKCEITSQIVELSPGQNTTVTLTVTNTSQVIDEFSVSLQPALTPETVGLNPTWLKISPTQFSLRPTQAGRSPVAGENQQAIKLVISLPPQVEANNYAGTIIVTARSGGSNSAQLPFNLIVSERDEQVLELSPHDQTSRRKTEIYRVTLANQGNSPHLYAVYAEDDQDDCLFEVVPPEVTLQPGEQAAFTLRVRPRRRNWTDLDQRYPFKVKLEGLAQEVSGMFVQKCALPPVRWLQSHWVRIAMVFGILLVLLVAAFIFLLPSFAPKLVSAACGPISERLVDVVSNNTVSEIHVSGPRGSENQTVVFSVPVETMPGVFANLISVSPDGRRLAYVTARNLSMDDAHIIVVDLLNLDLNKAPTRLQDIPVVTGLWPAAPVWSSNGEKLAYLKRPAPKAATAGAAAQAGAIAPNPAGTATVTTTGSPGLAGSPVAAAPSPSPTANSTTAADATPEADVSQAGGQLELWVAELNKPAPTKALAVPGRLKSDLFYGEGNRDRLNPVLCWSSDDLALLVRPKSEDKTDKNQTLISLASGKPQEITLTPAVPFLPITPKAAQAGLPHSALTLPLEMMLQPVVQAKTITAANATTCTITRFFSQNDPRWSNLALKTNSESKLGEWGCPITGAAILLNYQGLDATPETLNNCLSELNFTIPLNEAGWTAIGQQCGGFKLLNGVRGGFEWKKLDNALQNGPTIVGLLGGPNGLHFVVVTSGHDGEASTYGVVDPWDGSTGKTLEDFLGWGYRPRWLISYDQGPGSPCGVGTEAAQTQHAVLQNGNGTTIPVEIKTNTDNGPVDGGFYKNQVNFQYSVSGVPTATADILFTPKNGGADQRMRSPLPGDLTTLVDEGLYSINIVARGTDGQKLTSKHLYFTIDRTEPVIKPLLVSTTPLLAGNQTDKPVRLQFEASDDLSRIAVIKYQVNGSAFQTYSSDTVTAPPVFSQDGNYVIRYYAEDGAGNVSSQPEQAASISFSIQRNTNSSTPLTNTLVATTLPPLIIQTPIVPVKTLPPIVPSSNNNVTLPTVTPFPTATPRPAVQPTPTLAVITITAGTPVISPTGGISLLPTTLTPGATAIFTTPSPSPVALITSTVTPTVALTPTPTLAPTVVPTAILALDTTKITFDSTSPTRTLQISNTGNAPTNWKIIPGASASLINFSTIQGTLNPGAKISIDLNLVGPNLSNSNQLTSFVVNNGTSSDIGQTVNVTILPKPLPSATFKPFDVTNVAISQTVSLVVSTTGTTLVPDHAIITATYQICNNGTCAPSSVALNRAVGPDWSVNWDTSQISAQDNMSLTGLLCITTDELNCRAIPSLTGLQIPMGASISSPVSNSELKSQTQISVQPTGRAKLVTLTYYNSTGVTNTLPNATGLPNSNWFVNWDTLPVVPSIGVSNPVTLTAQVCDSTQFCRDIAPITGLTTRMYGTVTTSPTLTNGASISGTISTATTGTSANVNHVSVVATFRDAGSSAATAHIISKNTLPYNIDFNTDKILAQTGISLDVRGCYSTDETICASFALYTGLVITPGQPVNFNPTSSSDFQQTFINTAFAYPLAVQATDSKGNPVPNLTVQFQAPTTAGSPTGTFADKTSTFSGQTDATGTITTTIFTANGIVGSYVVTATNSVNQTTTVNLTNSSPTQINLILNSGSPQFAPILNPFPNKLAVLVVDRNQNPVSGVPVTFQAPTTTGPGGSFTGGVTSVVAISNVSGIATEAETFTANKTLGSFFVRASAPGYNPVNFTLTNQKGDPDKITLNTPSGSQAPILNQFGGPFQATVIDAGGNLLDNITLIFQAPDLNSKDPSGTFNASLATNPAASNSGTALTNGSGVATMPPFFANYHASAAAYPITVTWSVTGKPVVTAATQFSLINQVGLPFTVTMVPLSSPLNQVKSLQPYSGTFTATVVDQGNNLVPSTTVSLTVVPAGPVGAQAGGSFSTATPTATTNASGVATFASGATFTANCVINTPYNIQASATGATPGIVSLTNVVGDPGQLTIVGSSAFTATVQQNFGAMKVQVLDSCVAPAQTHPIDGVGITFSLPITTTNTDPGGIFQASASLTTSVTTSNGGLADVPTVRAGNAAGNYSLNAKLNLNPAVNNAFSLTNQAGSPANLIVSATSLTTTVNSQFSGTGTPLSVTVEDQFQNKVNGAAVNFATPNLPNTQPTATFNNANSGIYTSAKTSGTNGVATADALFASKKIGSYPLTITVGSLTQSVTLNNTPGLPSVISPNTGIFTATVDTAFTPNFNVQVLDSNNNPVAQANVTYTVNPNGGITGFLTADPSCATATSKLTTQSFQGDASGNVTPYQFCAGQKAGNYTLSITAGTASATYNLTNLADTTPNSIVLTAASQTLTTTVVATNFPAFTVVVLDKHANPIPQSPVSFTSPSNDTTGTVTGVFPGGLVSSSGNTDNNGQFSVSNFTASNKAGQFTLVATAGTKTLNIKMVNTADPDSTQFKLIGTPATTIIVQTSAGTAFNTALVATLTDRFDNPIAGQTITFNAPTSGASGKFVSNSNPQKTYTTTGAGTATVAVGDFTANNTSGQYTVTASIAAKTATFTLQNNAGAANAANTTVSPTGPTVQVNTNFPNVVITVKDAVGNPVPGVTVSLSAGSINGASATFTSPNFPTPSDASGVITITAGFIKANTVASPLVNGVRSSYPVTLTLSSGSVVKTIFPVNTPGPAAGVAPFPSSPVVITGLAGGDNYGSLQVVVTDSFGNPVTSGTDVLFSVPTTGPSGSFGSLQADIGTTDNNGIASSSQPLTSNGSVGEFAVNAALSLSPAISTTNFSITNEAAINQTSGSGQTLLDTQTAAALQANVTGFSNTGLTGVPVTFDSGGTKFGTFSNSQSTFTTNSAAGAVSANFTAGNFVGVYPITATVTITPGLQVKTVYTMVNTVNLSTSSATQSKLAGGDKYTLTTLVSGLTNSVKVAGVPVVYTISNPSGGTFTTSGTVTSDAAGLASVDITTGSLVGTFNVTATVQVSSTLSVTQVFTLTNYATISVNSGNNQTKLLNGESFSPLQVNVQGFGGALLSGVPITFTVATSGAVASSSLVGTSSAGIAQVSETTGSTYIGAYTVVATYNDGVTAPQTVTFNLANTVKMAVVTASNNQSVITNTVYPTTLAVNFRDFTNTNITLSSAATVTFTISSGPGLFVKGAANTPLSPSNIATISSTGPTFDLGNNAPKVKLESGTTSGTITIVTSAVVNGVIVQSTSFTETVT